MTKLTVALASLASAILTLTVGLEVPAYASSASPAAITVSVLNSSDPQAAFLSLSEQDRATFLDNFRHQTSVTVISRGGSYTPTAAERAAMTTSAAPAALTTLAASAASGCWWHYFYRSWYDVGIHDGDSWMQLNWCGSGGRITSWHQSNYGCAGHNGATCSVDGKANLNVGWEVRSTRYYRANFFGFNNTFCMQIRGGATGRYSQNSSASSGCPLN